MTETQAQVKFEKPLTLDKMKPEERADYDTVLAELKAYMDANGKQAKDIHKPSGIPASTLYPWLDGTTTGNYQNATDRVRKWLNSLKDNKVVDETRAQWKRPDFVETDTARAIIAGLGYAQSQAVMVSLTYGTGMGKSTAALHFKNTRANVHYILLNQTKARPARLVEEILNTLGIDRQRKTDPWDTIHKHLAATTPKSLLIFDEGQYLNEKGLNDIRYLYDAKPSIGIALLGNSDLSKKIALTTSLQGAGQVQSRFRLRKINLKPNAQDINIYLDAWGIVKPELRKVLSAIGMKVGSLREISETLESALSRIRNPDDLTPEIIRKAWQDRSAEILS